MAKPKAPPPFQRRLEERNPYLFVEYWKEGERPFNWFAEWEHLSLEVFDLRPSIKHENVSRKFSVLYAEPRGDPNRHTSRVKFRAGAASC